MSLSKKTHDSTIRIHHFAALWRGHGLKEFQTVHADSGPGNYHAVCPMTAEYEIVIYPGTHLLHETREAAKNDQYYVTPTVKTTLYLQVGQILVFHSNIGHCGGRAGRRKKEDKKQFIESDINIDWFNGKKSGKEVSDLAMHYGIENTLFHKTIYSDFESNVNELFRVHEENP